MKVPGRLCMEEMKIRFSSKFSTDIWPTVPNVLRNIHVILSSYWKFHGSTEVYVYCPHCIGSETPNSETPNYLRLMQFTETKVYEHFQMNNSLCCSTCRNPTAVEHLMPPSTIKMLECFMVNEKQFTDLCRFTEWELASPLPRILGPQVSQSSELESMSSTTSFTVSPLQAQT